MRRTKLAEPRKGSKALYRGLKDILAFGGMTGIALGCGYYAYSGLTSASVLVWPRRRGQSIYLLWADHPYWCAIATAVWLGFAVLCAIGLWKWAHSDDR